MDIPQKKVFNNKILWILTSIIVLIGLFFALIGFAEFFNVAVVGEPRMYQYPWGSTNEIPWYYEDSHVYSSYNLISGSSFLIASIFTVCARIKKNKILSIVGALLIILLVVAEYISSSIQ